MDKRSYGITVSLVVLSVASSWAGRPLTVDDAGIPTGGQVQTEWGGSFSKGPEDQKNWACPPTLSVGLYNRFQVGLSCAWSRAEAEETVPLSGLGDLGGFAKVHWLDERGSLPAVATTFSQTFPTASQDKGLSTGKPDYDLLLILTKGLGPLSVSLNTGYTLMGKPEGQSVQNVWHGGGAFEWTFSKKASLVGEIFGASSSYPAGPDEWQADSGLRLFPFPWAMLDASLGRGLEKSDPDFTAMAGVTFTFPVNK